MFLCSGLIQAQHRGVEDSGGCSCSYPVLFYVKCHERSKARPASDRRLKNRKRSRRCFLKTSDFRGDKSCRKRAGQRVFTPPTPPPPPPHPGRTRRTDPSPAATPRVQVVVSCADNASGSGCCISSSESTKKHNQASFQWSHVFVLVQMRGLKKIKEKILQESIFVCLVYQNQKVLGKCKGHHFY